MKRLSILSILIVFIIVVIAAFPSSKALAQPSEKACWGQATKVFASTGEMGEHASSQTSPRLGLRNLARALYQQGVIEDDTMQSLGRFVVSELGLSIDACR